MNGEWAIFRECAGADVVKDSFQFDEDTCYDLLDPEQWAQFSEGDGPVGGFSRYDVSFCTSDMCNNGPGVCENKLERRLSDFFGKLFAQH